MNVNEDFVEQEEFRLVLVLPWLQIVLAEHRDHVYRLPRISIPRWIRVAAQLTEVILTKWAVRSIVIDLLPRSDELSQCAVVEVRSHDWRFSLDGFTPVQVGDLDEQELTAMERLSVSGIIAGEARGRGPFSRLGWIEEAQEWIRESVSHHRVDFTDDVRPYSAGGFFILVRFGTLQGPAYWLKATCAPNAHEFTVTQAISRYCPNFVPPLIAARTDWNAWVTEEVGQPLRGALSLHALEQTAHSLARLQITSAAHVEDLLACGCFDQRMPVLRSHLPDLMCYLEDAMARQTSTKVPPLSANRLHQLACFIGDASAAMEAIAIPDSLIHNDMNPCNILYDGVRVVFTDWSEAGIGSPFLTFQHLQIQAVDADETHTWAPRLKEIYKLHWRNVLRESQIERAFALSPPLAIASYLCGRDPSFTTPYRYSDSVQSYARSLARQMDRSTQSLEFLEALCN